MAEMYVTFLPLKKEEEENELQKFQIFDLEIL